MEHRNMIIGNGRVAEAVRPGGASAQIVDRGGAQNDRPPSIPPPADENDEDIDYALKVTPLIESINFVY